MEIEQKKERYPNAQYFVCEFSQDAYSGDISVSHVLSPQGYTEYAPAQKAAEDAEQEMYRLGRYGCTIQARFAASFQDAKNGDFLDR